MCIRWDPVTQLTCDSSSRIWILQLAAFLQKDKFPVWHWMPNAHTVKQAGREREREINIPAYTQTHINKYLCKQIHKGKKKGQDAL